MLPSGPQPAMQIAKSLSPCHFESASKVRDYSCGVGSQRPVQPHDDEHIENRTTQCPWYATGLVTLVNFIVVRIDEIIILFLSLSITLAGSFKIGKAVDRFTG